MRLLCTFVALCLATPGSAQTTPRWTAAQDLRIGAVDHPQYGLSAIGTVIGAADGTIYVSQVQEQTIRVFDSGGRFLRVIGGAGAGPGEFEGLRTIGWRGDTLFATDIRHRRVTFFDDSGRHAGDFTLAVPLSFPFLSGVPSALLPDGTMLLTPGVAVAAIARGQVRSIPTLHVDRAGAVIDTVLRIPIPPAMTVIERRGARFGVAAPLPATPVFEASGTDWVVVDRPLPGNTADGVFRVLRVAPDGDTTLDRRYRHTPVQVNRTYADSIFAALVRRYTRTAARWEIPTGELTALLREHIELPGWMPAVTAVVVSHEGDIWLRREDRFQGDAVWHVLDPAGDVIGAVSLPAGITVHSVRGDAILASVTDALDVPYVLRFRLSRDR